MSATMVISVAQAAPAFAVPGGTKEPCTTAQTGACSGSLNRVGPAAVGQGDLTVTPATVKPGEVITISGTGFAARTDAAAGLVLKLEDGRVKFDSDTSGADSLEYNKAGYFTLLNDHLPKDGSFSVRVKVPASLPDGPSWVRILGTGNGDQRVSKIAWFNVSSKGEAPSTSASQAAVTFGHASMDPRSRAMIPITLRGLPANTEVSVTVDGHAAGFLVGRWTTAPTVTTDATGAYNGTLFWDKGGLFAGPHTIVFKAGDQTVTGETTIAPVAGLTSATTNVLQSAIGATVNAKILQVPPTASVTFLGVGDTNFLTSPVTSEAGATKTDKKTKQPVTDPSVAIASNIHIPDNPALIGQRVTVKWTLNGKEYSGATETFIAPKATQFGTESWGVQEADLPVGLYQAVYSKKYNKLFVTRTDGGSGMVKSSSFEILDPTTLKVLATIPVPSTGKNGVYGLALDENHDLLWTTDTRADGAAVWKIGNDGLSLTKLHQWSGITHPYAIAVDPVTGYAYVSQPVSGITRNLTRLDANNFEKVEHVSLGSFQDPMSLTLNPDTGVLATASLSSPQAVTLNVRDPKATPHIYALPQDSVSRSVSAVVDDKDGSLLVSSQGSNNVVSLDLKTGATKWTPAFTNTGEGALNQYLDPVSGKLFVANLTAGTVSVIDPATGVKVAQFVTDGGPVFVAGGDNGSIYVLAKSSRFGADTHDSIYRITLDGNKGIWGSSNLPKIPGSSDIATKIPGSSGTNQSGLGSIAGVFAAVVAAIGAAWFALTHGVIPANLLPAPLRALLKI